MQLRYINIPLLIAEAGGDPWAINQSLQSGRPAQISDLAEAFHAAGVCTTESSKAFADARDRFEAAWNRETGGHPINDSDEVQRVTKSLGAQSLQLPKIGVDLEKIAAALAEAQKAGAARIAALETQLQTLDNMIGQALEMETDPHLGAADRDALHAFITTCEDDAIRDTKAALGDLQATRNGYAATLHSSMAGLHSEGYDPPASVGDWIEGPLQPDQARNLGPVAGTGANPGIPGIGAADLGEVVQLPDGRYVAIFGDSFSGNGAYDGTHYPSVAVPVTFDDQGRPHFGEPLTGPDGSPNVLFPPPLQAAGKNTLPAGSIRMRDGTTYVMATGTSNLKPDGGSWLTRVTNDPGRGWQPIEGSWRAPGAGPTQISGFQAADGNVYIAADSFDRSQGVSMYRVDPSHVADRNAWQPWTGNSWGPAGQQAMPVSQSPYGELSFREVDGKAVLSGFNQGTGNVEVRVVNDPTKALTVGPTVVAQQSNPQGPNFVPQNYGGFILPGSTLDNLNLFVSQWNTATNTPYNTQQFEVNANRQPTHR
ncbi:DUF4185 domain-containing protein [Mycobacterium sp. Aquia_216]|uniref:putative alpha/beta hydrolase n=1 Tax=Mycobacterium sp. Aquia_216 TaxID=2991729 RepID=UPI00227AE2C6|nr:DUF4185 domain-containing protein [Mycobacterium sp. Aquia_216]WAJ46820.1 DUF4185 domain-containing protein [Mycobacterium sp. Aquia_216]